MRLPMALAQPRPGPQASQVTHLGAELVHDMAKLMEVSLHFVMLQQGRRVRGRLGEVGHHGCDGQLPATILPQAAGL